MKRSRFSEEQIIAILKEQEAGMATAEVCRRHGISSPTFYKWKSTTPFSYAHNTSDTPEKAMPSPFALMRDRVM